MLENLCILAGIHSSIQPLLSRKGYPLPQGSKDAHSSLHFLLPLVGFFVEFRRLFFVGTKQSLVDASDTFCEVSDISKKEYIYIYTCKYSCTRLCIYESIYIYQKGLLWVVDFSAPGSIYYLKLIEIHNSQHVICNHLQPSAIICNHLQPSATIICWSVILPIYPDEPKYEILKQQKLEKTKKKCFQDDTKFWQKTWWYEILTEFYI